MSESTAQKEPEEPVSMDVCDVEESQSTKEAPGIQSPRYIDENGRRAGKVLWYNIEKKFGFIIPEEPGAKILKVLVDSLVSQSDDDSVKALQKNQIVKYKNLDDISATEVKTSGEEPIDFSVKIADELPRYILPPPAGMQWGGSPHHPAAPTEPLPPQLKADEDKIVKGKVVHWINGEGWGFIQPDGDFQKIVVERAEIESEAYPGLDIDLRVQFRVVDGPYVGSVAASQVFQEDGSKIVYVADFMKHSHPVEPESDEIHKGTVVFFGGPSARPWGFIQPDGTEGRDAQMFVHISQTQWMPLKIDSKVQYKIGLNKKGKNTAVCVTGIDGAPLEFDRPKKRPRSQKQIPAPTQAPPQQFFIAAPFPGFRGAPGRYAYAPGPLMRNSSKKRKKIRKTKSEGASNAFECSLCDCSMNSEVHFQGHVKGKQHQKKLKTSGTPPTATPTTNTHAPSDTSTEQTSA